MTEEDARRVTLLQAYETAQPPSPLWGDEDRAWATRLALQGGTGGADGKGGNDDMRATSRASSSAGPSRAAAAGPSGAAGAEAFIARRAQHALQRLAPRDAALASARNGAAWAVQATAWAALGAWLIGLLADSIGSSQRINLLAPPLWGVLAWNAVVYLVLLGHGLARLLARPTRPGLLRRLTERVLHFGRGLAVAEAPAGGVAAPLSVFAGLWLRRSAPLSGARAAVVLHVAAAALALGLIGGLYLRGLVLDYRAGWESTFLDAGAAHAVVSTLLAPAATLAQIALPDATGFAALRGAHGSASAGAPAGPWIHLFALTLLGFVVLPRAALAAAAALRARWLAGHIALPLEDAYFQRLARQQLGDVAQVVVQPYASGAAAEAAPRLLSLLAPVLGDGLALSVAPGASFGAEDAPIAAPPAGSTIASVLFDLSATPEVQVHGRYLQAFAAGAPAGAATIVLVDEAAFRARFGADSARLAQRREAWRVFTEALGTLPVFIDLDAPDAPAVQRGVQLALRSPVTAVPP
jgi:Protein of unknown function (DUF2868)